MKKGDILTIKDVFGRILKCEVLASYKLGGFLFKCYKDDPKSSVVFGMLESEFYSNYQII